MLMGMSKNFTRGQSKASSAWKIALRERFFQLTRFMVSCLLYTFLQTKQKFMVIGHPKNVLCLWIMVFLYLLMNNGGSLLILISAGGRIVRNKDSSIVLGDYRKVLAEPTPKKDLQLFKLGNCITILSYCKTVPMRAMIFLLGIDHKTIDLFVDAHFIGGMKLMLWGMQPPSPSINYGLQLQTGKVYYCFFYIRSCDILCKILYLMCTGMDSGYTTTMLQFQWKVRHFEVNPHLLEGTLCPILQSKEVCDVGDFQIPKYSSRSISNQSRVLNLITGVEIEENQFLGEKEIFCFKILGKIQDRILMDSQSCQSITSWAYRELRTLQIKLAQLPAVDMQKLPGRFCCYSNHTHSSRSISNQSRVLNLITGVEKENQFLGEKKFSASKSLEVWLWCTPICLGMLVKFMQTCSVSKINLLNVSILELPHRVLRVQVIRKGKGEVLPLLQVALNNDLTLSHPHVFLLYEPSLPEAVSFQTHETIQANASRDNQEGKEMRLYNINEYPRVPRKKLRKKTVSSPDSKEENYTCEGHQEIKRDELVQKQRKWGVLIGCPTSATSDLSFFLVFVFCD
ncbi:hypothetical protein VP01_1667g1 [Puccinia sorghi]|uniref:Uncharacterized protein n=1 Tax=Puccinia sorghi TaxID=27349 RepID=A0A0L6VI08_9BASI|nr:hypothetical protein VP01_1667g1 [Puccinia sorghi]